jgi:hypothetical protein
VNTNVLIVIVLTALTVLLMVAVRLKWITDNTLQQLASVVTIIAWILAVIVFVTSGEGTTSNFPTPIPTTAATISIAISSTPPSPIATATLTSTRTPGEFDPRLALKLIFGSDSTVYADDKGEVYAVWQASPEDARTMFRDPERANPVRTHVTSALPFRQDNMDKYLVLTESLPNTGGDCVLCAPALGGALFTWRDGTWQIDVADRSFMPLGRWGSAPQGQLAKIGPDKHGVEFRYKYDSQGYIYEYLIIVGALGDEFRVILDEKISESNSGACGPQAGIECYGYSSDTSYVVGANPEYYDLVIKTLGTRLTDQKPTWFNETKAFTFVDSQYQPIK